MKPDLEIVLTIGLLFLLACSPGCSHSNSPPPPLALDQLPAEFEKAFKRAPADPQGLANQVVASVRARDYGKAFMDLQALAGLPGLTKEQTLLVARGTLTLRESLQAAQSQGDQKAAEILKFQHLTR